MPGGPVPSSGGSSVPDTRRSLLTLPLNSTPATALRRKLRAREIRQFTQRHAVGKQNSLDSTPLSVSQPQHAASSSVTTSEILTTTPRDGVQASTGMSQELGAAGASKPPWKRTSQTWGIRHGSHGTRGTQPSKRGWSELRRAVGAQSTAGFEMSCEQNKVNCLTAELSIDHGLKVVLWV